MKKIVLLSLIFQLNLSYSLNRLTRLIRKPMRLPYNLLQKRFLRTCSKKDCYKFATADLQGYKKKEKECDCPLYLERYEEGYINRLRDDKERFPELMKHAAGFTVAGCVYVGTVALLYNIFFR